MSNATFTTASIMADYLQQNKYTTLLINIKKEFHKGSSTRGFYVKVIMNRHLQHYKNITITISKAEHLSNVCSSAGCDNTRDSIRHIGCCRSCHSSASGILLPNPSSCSRVPSSSVHIAALTAATQHRLHALTHTTQYSTVVVMYYSSAN